MKDEVGSVLKASYFDSCRDCILLNNESRRKERVAQKNALKTGSSVYA